MNRTEPSLLNERPHKNGVAHPADGRTVGQQADAAHDRDGPTPPPLPQEPNCLVTLDFTPTVAVAPERYALVFEHLGAMAQKILLGIGWCRSASHAFW